MIFIGIGFITIEDILDLILNAVGNGIFLHIVFNDGGDHTGIGSKGRGIAESEECENTVKVFLGKLPFPGSFYTLFECIQCLFQLLGKAVTGGKRTVIDSDDFLLVFVAFLLQVGGVAVRSNCRAFLPAHVPNRRPPSHRSWRHRTA